MTDPPPYEDAGSNSGDDTVSTPRWVKVFGIIALVVVLLFLILMFARGPGGRHGPSRHIPSGGAGSQIPLSSVVADDAPSEGRCG
jgi:hypothetical protein